MPEKDSEEFTATSNDPKHQKRDDPGFTPGAGCLIIALVIALFTGIAIFAIYSGVRQDRDIAGFTNDERLELPDQPGTPEEVKAVRAKLDDFKQAIREKRPTSLELSPRDVNILLHNQTNLMEVRDMVYFDAVTPEGITGRISMPLKRLAFWKGYRYVNGTFRMTLEASPGRLFLRLNGIDSAGNEIPPGFIERISQDDLLDTYKNEDNEDIYAAIQSATMNDGSVTIEADPAKPTVDGE